MSWRPEDEQAFLARRRRLNIMIGVLLAVLVLLFYGISISRLSAS